MADKGKGRGFWRRLATVAAVVVVTTPVAAPLLPFDGTIRYQIQESLAFLIMFGWWLYLRWWSTPLHCHGSCVALRGHHAWWRSSPVP